MQRIFFNHLGSAALAGTLATAMPALAQDFNAMSKEEQKQLVLAYTEMDVIDQVLVVCNELAPDYAAANKAIMAEFKAARSIGRIQPLAEQLIAELKDRDAKVGAALQLTLPITRKAMRVGLESQPEKCEAGFEAELLDTDFPAIAAVADAFDLDAPVATVAETAPAAPAAPATRADNAANQQTAVTAAATPTHDVGMPAPISEVVDELPGISWASVDGVYHDDISSVYCVWRCVGLEYGDISNPKLFIQEAVPLGADEAIDQMLALYKRFEVVGQETIDPGDLASRMTIQPERLVMRRVMVERSVSVDRQTVFALEKDGLTIVAQLDYNEDLSVRQDAEKALSQVVMNLQMDRDTVLTALAENPAAMTIEAARGAPPADGQVIYAETPDPTHNTLTLSVSYDDDARYLEQTVLENDGPVIEMDDTPYYYVPPQPEGTTIEGVFTSADGSDGVGVSVLKSETLVFGRNGRYATSASSGVVGGLASTGSSSAGEGSYHIDGYTLELRSDDGTVHKDVFFPYMSRTFWPGSDGPADEYNFINLGGKILYRDDD